MSKVMGDPSVRRLGRPRKAESFRQLVMSALAQTPKIPTLELLRRATLEGYAGGKSAFYALVAEARSSIEAAATRDPLPGEGSRHDWLDVGVVRPDGSRRRVRLFVTRFEYSRWVAVSVLGVEGFEAVARALVDHFVRAGGVPLLATFDAAKIDVSRAKEPTDFVASLAYLALDLGFGVELGTAVAGASSGRSWTKELRHQLLPIVRAAESDVDLDRRLEAWANAFNASVAEETNRTPASLLVEERRRLRPVRVSPSDLTLRMPIVVRPGGLVVHDGRRYLLAADAAGATGTLYLTTDQIRIVAGGVTGIFRRFLTTPSARDSASA